MQYCKMCIKIHRWHTALSWTCGCWDPGVLLTCPLTLHAPWTHVGPKGTYARIRLPDVFDFPGGDSVGLCDHAVINSCWWRLKHVVEVWGVFHYIFLLYQVIFLINRISHISPGTNVKPITVLSCLSNNLKPQRYWVNIIYEDDKQQILVSGELVQSNI